MTFDADDNLYVALREHDTILKFTEAGDQSVRGGGAVRAFSICLSLLMLVVVGADARHRVTEPAPQTDFTGTWIGTWEGAGTGGFELTLEKGKDGKLGGQVSVTGEPTYKATLKTLTIEDQKMNATYDFPPDEAVEVTLAATFDGNTAKGTWAAIQKGGGELASGTWTVAKK